MRLKSAAFGNNMILQNISIGPVQTEEVVLSRLKPSTRKISIRLPESMIEELKTLANKRDVPYQSLLKIFLSERIDSELHQ